MTTTLTDQQRAYLTDHMWAMLATGRKDGSPQVSMIGYVLDEEDRLVISIKSYTFRGDRICSIRHEYDLDELVRQLRPARER